MRNKQYWIIHQDYNNYIGSYTYNELIRYLLDNLYLVDSIKFIMKKLKNNHQCALTTMYNENITIEIIEGVKLK